MLIILKSYIIYDTIDCNKFTRALMSEQQDDVETLKATISSLQKDVAALTGENSRLNSELAKKLEPHQDLENQI